MTVSFIVLILVVSGLTFIYTYGETKDALKETTRDELKEIAAMISTQIDGDVVLQFQAGDEGTAAYNEMKDALQLMRSYSEDVVNCYIMVIVDGELFFMLDDSDDADAAMIGDAYESDDHDLIVAALASPQVSEDFYTDIWGSFLSGYAPVLDSNGTAVAVLGVDMDASDVIGRQNFIGNTIYMILAASVVLAGAIVALFAMTMIRDIKKLNKAAEMISMGDLSAEVDITRKDEIGDLSESFSRMVASLKFELMSRQEDEGKAK